MANGYRDYSNSPDWAGALSNLSAIIQQSQGRQQQNKQFGMQMQQQQQGMQERKDEFLADMKFRRELAEENLKLTKAGQAFDELKYEAERGDVEYGKAEAKRGQSLVGQFQRGKTEYSLDDMEAGAKQLTEGVGGNMGVLNSLANLMRNVPKSIEAAGVKTEQRDWESIQEMGKEKGMSDADLGLLSGLLGIQYESPYDKEMKTLDLDLKRGLINLQGYENKRAELRSQHPEWDDPAYTIGEAAKYRTSGGGPGGPPKDPVEPIEPLTDEEAKTALTNFTVAPEEGWSETGVLSRITQLEQLEVSYKDEGKDDLSIYARNMIRQLQDMLGGIIENPDWFRTGSVPEQEFVKPSAGSGGRMY